jgi:hypothetical protein
MHTLSPASSPILIRHRGRPDRYAVYLSAEFVSSHTLYHRSLLHPS